MEIARFEKRIFAYLIDILIAVGLGCTSGALLFIYTKIPWYFSMLLTILNCYLIYLIINVPLMFFTKGRTIGSFIFRIKTISVDNNPITFKDCLIKNLYFGLIPVTIVNAVYMLIVHTEKTIIDTITDTISVDSKKNN